MMLFRKKRKLSSHAASAKEPEKAESSTHSKSGEEEWNETSAETHTTAASVASVATRNHCVYCHRDEENDPAGTNQDDYLACSVCGDNAHQQCARKSDSLKMGTALEDWRCPGCVENSLEPAPSLRRLSVSSNRMTRNLLATGQDTAGPVKYSIFNTLILEDDPLDGSRTLRKRKASSEAAENQQEISKKLKRIAEGPSQTIASHPKQTPSVKDVSVPGTPPTAATSPEPSEPEYQEVSDKDDLVAGEETNEAEVEIESESEREEEEDESSENEGGSGEEENEEENDSEEEEKKDESDSEEGDKEEPQEEKDNSDGETAHETSTEAHVEPEISLDAPSPKNDDDDHSRLRARARARNNGRKRTWTRGRSRARGGSRAVNNRRTTRHAMDIDKKADIENPIILKSNSKSLVLRFKLDPAKFRNLRLKKKSRSLTFGAMTSRSVDYPPHAAPFYSLHDRETEELKSKPYGGILNEADADTNRTLPSAVDRAMFEEAQQKAEEEWKRKTEADEGEPDYKNRKISGPPSKIKCINFGGYEIETWYAAPYPEEYSRNRVLYICEFCLKYMGSDYVAWRHKLKCPAKHPPGDEIYKDKSISVFEVDGRKNPVYCQNLCLLAKLFLGSKTLYYDVEPFLFYIMTEFDELGCHFVGYFSKEKRPSSMNNVSCILTLPIHQRKGYGNLLIDFSYLLTRVEKKTGSPEKPLSDMGLVSYRNYWRLVLSYLLVDQKEHLSITDLSDKTGMTADDIVAALEALRALVRDPVTKSYALRLDYDYFKQCIDSWEAKNYVRLNPDALIWTPYIMGRGNLATYDRAPAISTVAPRDDEDESGSMNLNSTAPKQNGVASASTQPQTNGVSDQEVDLPLVQVNGTSVYDEEQETVLMTTEQPMINDNHSVGMPATPQTFDTETPRPKSPSPIPPTRYEVYPPVVGPTRQRGRGGWRGRGRGGSSLIRRNGKPFSAVTPRIAAVAGGLRGQSRANREASPLRRARGKPTVEVSANGEPRSQDDPTSDADPGIADEDLEMDAEGAYEEIDIASPDDDADSYHEVNDDAESASEVSMTEEVADVESEEDEDSDQNDTVATRSRKALYSRGRTRSRGNTRASGGRRLSNRLRRNPGSQADSGVEDEDQLEEDPQTSSSASVSNEGTEEETEKTSEDSDQDAEGEVDVDDDQD